MKALIPLLAAVLLAPLDLRGEPPAPAEAVAPPPSTPATSPGSPRIPRVEFEGVTLHELVTYLQAQSKTAGHDPNTDPLNVVISASLGERRIPALSLRNVSPTEVLTIATTVLGLTLEPIAGDSGRPVAWLVKAAGPGSPSTVGAGSGSAAPAIRPEGAVIANVYSDSLQPSELPGFPHAVELATSSPGVDPMHASPVARPESRVFGVGSLVASSSEDPKQRDDERSAKLERLLEALEKMAADQGGKARVKAYREMDIVVATSTDRGVIALIAEAIDAMKANAPANERTNRSKEDALNAEMHALKAQLSIVQTEKDMQRQSLLDQIQLLKEAIKAEDAQRAKR